MSDALTPLDLPFPLSPVAMGCWPIAGITSIGVTEDDARETIAAAVDAGITHFDTAHAYGYDGESERLLGQMLRPHRGRVSIATKGGLVWGDADPHAPDAKRPQSRDGRPQTLRLQCEQSLSRLGLDAVDVYYLHAPDPDVPLGESAGAIADLIADGKARTAGVSNFTERSQYAAFAAECPIALDQQPYNLLQREIESDRIPWAQSVGARTVCYWPLMKGLLAGRLARDHRFAPRDSRQHYAVFREPNWSATHDLLDDLRDLAETKGCTVAQLVIAWTIAQPGLTAALCGAKQPEQIRETAAAMGLDLTAADHALIAEAAARRGAIEAVP